MVTSYFHLSCVYHRKKLSLLLWRWSKANSWSKLFLQLMFSSYNRRLLQNHSIWVFELKVLKETKETTYETVMLCSTFLTQKILNCILLKIHIDLFMITFLKATNEKFISFLDAPGCLRLFSGFFRIHFLIDKNCPIANLTLGNLFPIHLYPIMNW